jgi:hypothetical protein
MRSRILPLILCIVVAALFISCFKAVDKNTAGPGGLPEGKVNTAPPPPAADESKLPLYPGAKRIANGSYETTDSLEKVVAYYSNLLKVEPTALGEKSQSRAYATPDFRLTLVPMDPASNGTEIHFALPAAKASK